MNVPGHTADRNSGQEEPCPPVRGEGPEESSVSYEERHNKRALEAEAAHHLCWL